MSNTPLPGTDNPTVLWERAAGTSVLSRIKELPRGPCLPVWNCPELPALVMLPLLSCSCSFPQKAVELMCLVPKRCNDMMNLGRLQGFEVSLQACSWALCLLGSRSQAGRRLPFEALCLPPLPPFTHHLLLCAWSPLFTGLEDASVYKIQWWGSHGKLQRRQPSWSHNFKGVRKIPNSFCLLT